MRWFRVFRDRINETALSNAKHCDVDLSNLNVHHLGFMLSSFVNFSASPLSLTLYNCYCIFDYLIHERDFEWSTQNEESEISMCFSCYSYLPIDFLFVSLFFRGYYTACCNLPHHLYWCSSFSALGSAPGIRCWGRSKLRFLPEPVVQSLLFYWGAKIDCFLL